MTNQHPITPVPELAYQWRPISKKFARWVLEDSENWTSDEYDIIRQVLENFYD